MTGTAGFNPFGILGIASCLSSSAQLTCLVPEDKSSSCNGFGLGPGIVHRAPPMPLSSLLQSLTLPSDIR